METGGLSVLEIILWIVAANVLLMLAAYGLVYWLRKQSGEAIRQIGEHLQAYGSRLDQIASYLQEFVGIVDEPYATRLDELQKEASELQDEMQTFLSACQSYEAELTSRPANKLQGIINAPVVWYRRWRHSAELCQEGEQIVERLAAAEARIQGINELPWELATQSRQVEKDVAELVQGVQTLQSRNARGAALQAVVNQVPLLRRGLNEIPAEFLQADHDALLNAVNLDMTIRVFDVLNRVRPALARYLPQVREWNAVLQKATADFNELKQVGANLRQVMAHPPAGLVLSNMQERLDQVAQMAGDISGQMTQPEVENLKPLAREVSQLRRVLQDTEQQLTRASQQVNQLSQSLTDLQSGLSKLGEQLLDLEKRDMFPLAWDQSSLLLEDLRKRLQSLGPAQQPRTPEQITQHLKETEGLRSGYKQHAEALPKVAEQHRVLVALLQSPELKDGSTWLRKARETLAQTTLYDPRNWPKQDSLQTLPVELEELVSSHERLVPADQAAPVKESELAQRVKDTQQLLARHKALRPRIESVRARLEKLQAMEKEGEEKLRESFNALDIVLRLTDSNELLDSIATAEIDRLSEEIRQLGNELNAQNQGEMEKKQQKINAQAEKVNRALNGWLASLNQSIADQGKAINSMLIQLDAIARLDEPVITDARNGLAREDYLTAVQGGSSRSGSGASTNTGAANSTPAPKAASSTPSGLRGMAARVAERGGGAISGVLQRSAQLSDLEATAEIKRKNDLWQTLLAVHQALDEKVGSLLTAYQEVVQARSEAQEGLAEITRRMADRHAWPPHNQSPLSDTQVLRPVDEKWEMLKNQPRRVEPAILELGRLTQQYQLASERTRQTISRMEQDVERVQELEEQIDELKQRWQAQAQASASNPVVREGVQQLMSQADSKLAYVKHQYMRDALSYEQVIHNLQLLYDELFSARVSIDAQNDIGLNETHPRVQQTHS